MELLSKSQLQILNRRSNLRYPLDAAEKDYFLAYGKWLPAGNKNAVDQLDEATLPKVAEHC